MSHQCTYEPPCANREEMRERHGSPFMFQRAVRQAADDCFVTDDEAEASANAYRVAWGLGSCVTPSPQVTQPKPEKT